MASRGLDVKVRPALTRERYVTSRGLDVKVRPALTRERCDL